MPAERVLASDHKALSSQTNLKCFGQPWVDQTCSDKEPDQQLTDSSDQKESSTLSPLRGTSLNEEDHFEPRGEAIKIDPPTPPPVKPTIRKAHHLTH